MQRLHVILGLIAFGLIACGERETSSVRSQTEESGVQRGNEPVVGTPRAAQAAPEQASLSSQAGQGLEIQLGPKDSVTLKVELCKAKRDETCVTKTSNGRFTGEISLGAHSHAKSGQTFGAELINVGNHAGTETDEVAVLYQQRPNGGDKSKITPILAVVDLVAERILFTTKGPPSNRAEVTRSSFSDVVRDHATGRGYPFLAPGHEDSPQAYLTEHLVAGTQMSLTSWGYLCLLSPGKGVRGRCGSGFVEVATTPTNTAFQARKSGYWSRESGGFLLDTDSDGWDDIHLLFKGGIQVISGKNARELYTMPIDLSKEFRATEGLIEGFDSYRLRGITTGFTLATGGKRALSVSGVPVGQFNDHTCAVTRFVALLGMSATGGLVKWKDYYGFSSPFFRQNLANSTAEEQMVYRGEFANDCIHYFDDARAEDAGREIALVNYFKAADTAPQCTTEGYAAQLPGRTAADYDRYYKCMLETMCTARGTWKIGGYELQDGSRRAGGSNVYVWGWSKKLNPSRNKAIYIVEDLTPGSDGNSAYDFAGRMDVERFGTVCKHAPRAPSRPLRLTYLNGKFVNIVKLPSGARPMLNYELPQGSKGAGSGTKFPTLVTRPGKYKDSVQFKLDNGKWFGLEADGETWSARD